MKKKTVEEKISNALDIEIDEKEINEESTSIEKVEPKAIEVSADVDLKRDYKHARRNLRDLIKTGNNAIEGILNVASEGEHPRAYEVAAQLIKVVADTNKDLVDLHKKVKDIKSDDVKLTQNNTNNAIYVGSTSELQSLINTNRSSVKRLRDNNEDVIDGGV